MEEQEPKAAAKEEPRQELIVEPFPENASVTDLPQTSLWREILKKCSRVFWSWWGVPDIATDIEAHAVTAKKAAIIILLAVVVIVSSSISVLVKGWLDEATLRSTRDDLSKSDGAKQEAERDRDRYQTLFNQDENTVGPLRQIANEKFAASPPDKRVDLLLQKIESLQFDIDSKIQSLPTATITSKKIESLSSLRPDGNYETKVSLQIENAGEHTSIGWYCPSLVAKPALTPTGSGIGFGSSYSAPFSTAEMSFITSAPIKESDLQIFIGTTPNSNPSSEPAFPH